MSARERRFTTKDVLAACPGLDVNRLAMWLCRGHLRLAQKAPRRGRKRLYAASDVILIAATFEMAKLGIPLADAARVADVVRQHAVARQANNEPLILLIAHDAGLVFRWTPHELLYAQPGAFIAFNAERCIAEVEGRLRERGGAAS